MLRGGPKTLLDFLQRTVLQTRNQTRTVRKRETRAMRGGPKTLLDFLTRTVFQNHATETITGRKREEQKGCTRFCGARAGLQMPDPSVTFAPS